MTDAIGIPRPKLSYGFDEYTKAGMAAAERIHTRNLFLLGSGTYPTGTVANPTLTIAALSLRAVDSIAQTLVE